jgi:hypothetical protein
MVPKAGEPMTSAPGPNELQVVAQPGKTRELMLAEVAIEGVAPNARTAQLFTQPWFGEVGFTESVAALRSEIATVKGGDMANIEATLFGQAKALGAIFHACAQKAAANMGEYPQSVERYMRLALKAQSQCRTTLETLAEIKNPRSVAFVRQANIAGGHQQVNNGEASTGRAEIFENEPNELQRQPVRSLAAGAPPQSIGVDTRSAAVVEINRAKDR